MKKLALVLSVLLATSTNVVANDADVDHALGLLKGLGVTKACALRGVVEAYKVYGKLENPDGYNSASKAFNIYYKGLSVDEKDVCFAMRRKGFDVTFERLKEEG